MAAILEIQHLAKVGWDAGSPEANKHLFAGITAEIAAPEKIALIGPSGQGKSTMLRILALLDTPDAGELRLDGVSYKQANPRLWRMAVCYVAQQAVMLPGSIEDNLRTVSRLHGQPFDSGLAAQLLKRLGLDTLDLKKKADECSGGEKQRISLIRSLLLRPKVLLLDEITASLDVNTAHKVEELLMRWHEEEGTTLIWVTHDLEQAGRISNRTWMMEKGGLQEYSSPSFFAQPLTELLRRFEQPAEGSLNS